MHAAAAQYVGIMNDQLVCHSGVIQFPMRKGWKRVHRLVVLPDFQGLGIGTKFINYIGDLYLRSGLNFNLTTTTPALRYALLKSDKWELKRSGKCRSGFHLLSGNEHIKRSSSENRITYSFDYVSSTRLDNNQSELR